MNHVSRWYVLTFHILGKWLEKLGPFVFSCRLTAGHRRALGFMALMLFLPLAAYSFFSIAPQESDEVARPNVKNDSNAEKSLLAMSAEPPSRGVAPAYDQAATKLSPEIEKARTILFRPALGTRPGARNELSLNAKWNDDQPAAKPQLHSAKMARTSARSEPETAKSTPTPHVVSDDIAERTIFQRPAPKPWGDGKFEVKISSKNAMPVRNSAKVRSSKDSNRSYQVQLLALGGHEEALKAWDKLNKEHEDVLGSLDPTVSPRRSRNRRIIYRLRAGPMYSKNEAQAVCALLTRRDVDCLVILATG